MVELGFRVRAYGHGTGYGDAERGPVSLHLSEWDEHDPQRAGAHVYRYVADADALRAEWAASGVEGRFTDPGDTEEASGSSPSSTPTAPCTGGSRLR